MTSYQIGENINFQVVLWIVAGAVYRLVAMVWLVVRWTGAVISAVGLLALLLVSMAAMAGAKVLITAWPTLRQAGRVLAITAGWGAVIVAAVVISALYWHLLLALGGLALVAWATYPRSGSRQSRA